jgi:hypothetical protein
MTSKPFSEDTIGKLNKEIQTYLNENPQITYFSIAMSYSSPWHYAILIHN